MIPAYLTWALLAGAADEHDRFADALRGPDGCWIVAGTASWDKHGRLASSKGSAAFEAVFLDHVWTTYTLAEVVHTTTIGGVAVERTPIRPFGLVVGFDPQDRSDVVDGLAVWETRQLSTRSRPPPSVPRNVLQTLNISKGRLVARLATGETVSRSHSPWENRAWPSRDKSEYQATFGDIGFPLHVSSRKGKSSYVYDVTSVSACPEGFSLPPPPLPRAMFDDERTPDVAVLERIFERNQLIAELEFELRAARWHRRQSVLYVGLGAVYVVGGLLAPVDPTTRGAVVGMGGAALAIGISRWNALPSTRIWARSEAAGIAMHANLRPRNDPAPAGAPLPSP